MQEIAETVLRFEFPAVVEDGQPAVEVGVVPKHVLDVIIAEAVGAEDFRIGVEVQFGSGLCFFGRFVALVLGGDFTLGELQLGSCPRDRPEW